MESELCWSWEFQDSVFIFQIRKTSRSALVYLSLLIILVHSNSHGSLLSPFKCLFVLSFVFLSLCLCVLRSSLVRLISNREAAKEGVQEWEVARAGVAAMLVLYQLEFQRIFNLKTEHWEFSLEARNWHLLDWQMKLWNLSYRQTLPKKQEREQSWWTPGFGFRLLSYSQRCCPFCDSPSSP